MSAWMDRRLKELRADPPPRATAEGLLRHVGRKLVGTDEEVVAITEPLGRYLERFVLPTDDRGHVTCPACEAKLTGLLGSFTYGLVHGEGVCAAKVAARGSPRCGYPCRANHYVYEGDDREGDPVVEFTVILPYHPEGLRTKRGAA